MEMKSKAKRDIIERNEGKFTEEQKEILKTIGKELVNKIGLKEEN